MTFNCLSPVLIEEPVFLPHLHFHLYRQTSLEIKNLNDGIFRSCKSDINMLHMHIQKTANAQRLFLNIQPLTIPL